MSRTVIAIAAHPDDIEFVMAGTLLQLQARGWEVHYLNIANGCCGSTTLNREQAAQTRLAEAQQAASLLPATFHAPLCDDLEILYTTELLAQIAAIVRRVKPTIVLTHALIDYMEDHQNAARLAVGGAFVRGMPNYVTAPPEPSFDTPIAVYHAQPHGNRDPLGHLVVPSKFVDVTSLVPKKCELLSAHQSQDQWLDDSQKISSYLSTMQDLNREVGEMSGQYEFAEGWRQHLHLGLSHAGFDPLGEALHECSIQRGKVG